MTITVQQAFDWTNIASGGWRGIDAGTPPANAKGIVIASVRGDDNNPNYRSRFGGPSTGTGKEMQMHGWPAVGSGGSAVRAYLASLTDLNNLASNEWAGYPLYSDSYACGVWLISDSEVELEAVGVDATSTYTFTPDHDELVVYCSALNAGVSNTPSGATVAVANQSLHGAGWQVGYKALSAGVEETMTASSLITIHRFREVTHGITFPVARANAYESAGSTINESIGEPPANAQALVGYGGVGDNKYNLPGVPTYGGLSPDISLASGSSVPRTRIYAWTDFTGKSGTNLVQTMNSYSNNMVGYAWVCSDEEITVEDSNTSDGAGPSLDRGTSDGIKRAYLAFLGSGNVQFGAYWGSALDPMVGYDASHHASKQFDPDETGAVSLTSYAASCGGGVMFSAPYVGGGGSRRRRPTVFMPIIRR